MNSDQVTLAVLLVALVAVLLVVATVLLAHAIKASCDAWERAQMRAFRRRLAERDHRDVVAAVREGKS